MTAVASTGWSQTAPLPTPLQSYIQTALEQNPDVMASRARWKNTDAKVDEARSGLIPHFDFVSRYTGFSGGRILYFPSVGNFNASALGIVPWNNYFEVSWPIFNYGIWSGMSSSQAFRDASTAEVSAKELDVSEKVSEAYYSYAKANELVDIRKNADTLATENLRTAQALFANDKAPKNDVLRAEVGVASAEGDVLSAKNTATLAKTYFNNLLKRDFNADINLPKSEEITALVSSGSDIAATDGSSYDRSLPPMHDDVDKAFANRPEVAQLIKTQEGIDGAKRAAWSDFLPNVALFGSYGWQENTLQFSNNAHLLVGGLQMQWNFFSGFGTAAKIDEQEAQLEEVRYQTESAMNGIRLELESARLEKVNAIDRLAIGRKQVVSADENYRIVKAQYDNGLAPLITLIDAETTFANAKAYLTTTTYDVLIA
ncbi:MAG TPA: TolC family protein, partial [Steroidobacteraceae bacterium]|nr:TolC family protein [Steroidobacteraceae bacterium]